MSLISILNGYERDWLPDDGRPMRPGEFAIVLIILAAGCGAFIALILWLFG